MYQVAITLEQPQPGSPCTATVAVNGKPTGNPISGSDPADCWSQVGKLLQSQLGDAWDPDQDEPQPGNPENQGNDGSVAGDAGPAADGDVHGSQGGGLRNTPEPGIPDQDSMLHQWNLEAENRLRRRTTIMDVS
jgi:hypothetical protein